MDTHKGIDVIHWVKTHKFWTSVIILFIVTIIVRAFFLSIPFGSGRLSYLFFYGLTYYYTVIGGLIWSGYTRKKGMTLITCGVIAILFSLSTWVAIISNGEFEIIGFLLAVAFTILGVLLPYFGAKRYRDWLKSGADTAASSS